jgi:hypothetical protein
MYPIPSVLTSKTFGYASFRDAAAKRGFVLGGNWDYDQGSLDCPLDRSNQVWLRMPFEVVSGTLDSESEDTDAQIRLGEPYVLRHLYHEGLDDEAQPATIGGLVNQFAAPVDADAEVSGHWIEVARRKLGELESMVRDGLREG